MSALYDDTVKRFQDYVMPTYAPKTLFVKGAGAKLWDADNVEYLDFASGISVCNLGHCNKRVTAAITEQASKLVHISNLYLNELMPRLAEKLVKESFPGKVFFSNSGAEANEGMIKLARHYGNKTGRNLIITMDNSFHGRTLATLAATGRAKYRQGFEPDMPGFMQVPFNDFEALKAAVEANPNVCAIMLEMVQGEGGVLPIDAEYVKQVRALCDEKDILMLCDEVQCGMGRTGYRFAYQAYGVEPDALSMAKAIANGYPMGGFIAKSKFANDLTVLISDKN
jgi:acetylornithine/succinyldiaminopimelate/putrescine aminotransferase